MPINLQALQSVVESPSAQQAVSAGSAAVAHTLSQSPEQRSGVVNFLDAAQHHALGFFHNSANAVEKGVASLADMVDPVYQPHTLSGQVAAQRSGWNQALHNGVQGDVNAVAQMEKDYQARTAGSKAAYAGAALGEVAPWLAPTNLPVLASKGVALAGPAIRALPSALQGVASTALKGGIEGGILAGGGSQGDSNAAALGAALGGVGAPVLQAGVRAIGSGASYLHALAKPGDSAAKSVAALADNLSVDPAKVTAIEAPSGDPVVASANSRLSSPQLLAKALALTQSSVPGVKLTSDQAAAAALGRDNVPLVQLSQALRNSAGGASAFAQREYDNNAARMDYLRKHTVDPAALDKMVADRRAFAKDAMDSFTQPVDPSPVLDHIAELKQSSFGTDPVISRTLTALENQINKAADNTGENSAEVRPDLLDGIRQNLRNVVADNAGNGVVRSKQEAGLQPLAATISQAIESANPGYGDYLSGYAQRSVPINTAQAANSLLSSPTGILAKGVSNAGGDKALTLTDVASALKSLDKLDYGVSPDFKDALTNVYKDLQLKSTSDAKMGSPGSPTEYYGNLSGQVADAINGKVGVFDHPLAKALAGGAALADGAVTGGVGSGVTSALGALYGVGQASKLGGARLQNGYVNMLLNPDELAQTLNSVRTSPGALGSYLQNLPILGQ